MKNDTYSEIKQVIEKAYIAGIHTDQDENKVKSGFHHDFAMLVLTEGGLQKVNVEEWLTRVEVMKSDNPGLWASETRCTIEFIDTAGYAAAVKLEVFKGETHFSTDYMLLYRFDEGWKIVSKVFSVPV